MSEPLMHRRCYAGHLSLSGLAGGNAVPLAPPLAFLGAHSGAWLVGFPCCTCNGSDQIRQCQDALLSMCPVIARCGALTAAQAPPIQPALVQSCLCPPLTTATSLCGTMPAAAWQPSWRPQRLRSPRSVRRAAQVQQWRQSFRLRLRRRALPPTRFSRCWPVGAQTLSSGCGHQRQRRLPASSLPQRLRRPTCSAWQQRACSLRMAAACCLPPGGAHRQTAAPCKAKMYNSLFHQHAQPFLQPLYITV